MRAKIKDFVLMNVGTLMVAVGVYFFKFPNHFSTGGVSGLSIIFGELSGVVTPGQFVFLINAALLIIGFLVLQKSFGLKTIYCSILLSLVTRGLEIVLPLPKPLTDQKLLELVFSVLLPAIGSAILFNVGASTGGTDILAMILKKKTNLDIGKSLLCTDFLIAISAGLVFGIETGLFSLLGLAFKAVAVDTMIENLNLKKSMTIITTMPHEVCDYITKKLHRGATFWRAQGAYTDEERWVVLAAMDRMQASQLRTYVKSIDAHSFVVLNNTSEIIGKGFRTV